MFNYFSKIFSSLGLFSKAYGKYRKTILMLAGFGFLSGILGGVGIGAIIPLFSFVGAKSGVADGLITKMFKEAFGFFGVPFTLTFVMLVLVMLFVTKALFLFTANMVNAKAVARFSSETRNELLGLTMKAQWPYLLNRKVGYLAQVISEDVDLSAGVLVSTTIFIIFLTSLISYAVVALSISPFITIVTILIGAILSFLLKPLFYRIREMVRQETFLKKEATHLVNQHLAGAKTVKSMVVEQPVIQAGKELFQGLSWRRFATLKYQAVPSSFLEPVTLAVVIPIFFFSYRSPGFNIASFAAVLYLVQKMFSSVQSMQMRLNSINEGIPHLAAVVECQEEARQYQEESDGLDSFQFSSAIKFEDVRFSYEGGERTLDGLNLTIPKGEMVGLIGRSGSGKTTIADLLLRLFKTDGGAIRVDEVNINDLNIYAWRKKIGYVSQDMFLLNDTIENNIRFYGESISYKDVEQAAKLAHIYDFIEQRPDKFKTMVGERGIKLSAGQRQRVVLARMIARKPEILVLDEATSSLDNESEVAIQKSLEDLRGKITMLVIAHRLSTVMSSDRLLVLEGGKIIEEGEPEQLLENKDSHFFKMYHAKE